ncbi:restriction endonuclease subunit S [Pseudomonas monteilii]
MSSDWPLVQLADHVESCLGKMLDAKRNRGVLQPYLGNSNVRWGKFDISDLAEMKFETHEDERYSLRSGDLVVCEGGEPGRCAIWNGPAGMKIQKALHRIRPKETLDNYYLFYWFCLAAKTGHLEAHFTGTTIKHLTGKAIAALKVPLPPIGTQRAMVDVLRSIDDRIALLRETNATLEAIAQALFKSWFVDFDPVRAKAEGREPEGMDAANAALFPESFEESELGSVPEGWSYVSIREVTSIFDSQRVPLSGQERAKRKGNYPYYGAAALMDWVDSYLFDGIYLLSGEDGSVADHFGYPITQYVWGRFWVNNHAHVLQGRNGVSTEHLMLSLKQTNITPFITGAVQAKLSQSNMWRINFLMPSKEICSAFGELLKPIYASLRHNTEQSQTLTQLRDTLLPRLISGKLRLAEAEATSETMLSEAV